MMNKIDGRYSLQQTLQQTLRRILKQFLSTTFVGICVLQVPMANAGSLVFVRTSLGDFYLELNDEAAPNTVANFLNYVRDERFDKTYIHAAVGGTFIRGGSFTFDDCNQGPQAIPTDAPIAFEETGLSNLSGTIAMRHDGEDVNSATSEWYINIGNDLELDTENGGYVVFGRVIGDGLETITTISNAPGVRLSSIHTVPTSNYFGDEQIDCRNFSGDNLVKVLMDELDAPTDTPTGDFNSINGTLNVNLDLVGDGYRNLNFTVDENANPVTIQAQLDSVVNLQSPVANMARYNSANGELIFPSAAIDGIVQFRNLIFTLTDSETAQFTLVSSE